MRWNNYLLNQSLFQRLFKSSSCKSPQIEYVIIESKQFARSWCALRGYAPYSHYAATRRIHTGYAVDIA